MQNGLVRIHGFDAVGVVLQPGTARIRAVRIHKRWVGNAFVVGRPIGALCQLLLVVEGVVGVEYCHPRSSG